MNKVIIFNPRSTNFKRRIPNSILQVGASIHNRFEYVLVDGNCEEDPWEVIENYLLSGEYKYFGCTVMPGPQLRQAIPFTKKIKQKYPEVIIVWGGYFASNQYQVSINSGYVDFIINGMGDIAFPVLLDALENNYDYTTINNLIFRKDGNIIKTEKTTVLDMDELPELPYDYLNSFYKLKNYFGKTFLGERTASYHSSFGCPFSCSFCAVVPIYQARWKGKSAQLVYNDIKYLKERYGADSIEFFDNNFFVSEKRVVEFSKLVKPEKMGWWGEGRIDTIHKYSDESLKLMSEAGCKMIFLGAESGSDAILKSVDKGGNQSAEQMVLFAERLGKFGIVPEYSFVLGFPADTEEQVMQQIDQEILFIKRIKQVNPKTEIIIYVYSPVPAEGSAMYEKVKASGFHFPERLEDWLNDEWTNFDLRKNPLTPWLTPAMIDKIQNFETVLNARYPTNSDIKLSKLQRSVIAGLARVRYNTNFFSAPYELKLLQRFWLKYRQPEIEGAEML
ncbi:MAG: radical SAM protein [Ferruginibacter sp.]|nr:radical SAM protein [Chitinophagaceae bacterium]